MPFAFAPFILAAWGISAVAINSTNDDFSVNAEEFAQGTEIEALADRPAIGEGIDDYGSIINDLHDR